ncbi:hypothetical protein [Sphingobium abikonense]|uniref:hypothetical protein n=1 Tax=Sphingobium abikonense TaxID=86193 RepID=UPI0007871342|nr:hypothetical protein [Sphingobium abikonense]
MGEPKPLASLTSGLLARKGAAQPAMRRPMLGFGHGQANALQQDDLGWNDMGFDVEPAPQPMEQPVAIGLTPMGATLDAPVPPVVTEREELAERINAAPEAVRPVGKKTAKRADPLRAVAQGRKAAFTLRLDADRHLKLRLASAVTGRSAQQMLTQALDEFLMTLPEIDRLAEQLPHARRMMTKGG